MSPKKRRRGVLFYLSVLIIFVACSIITTKTVVGYSGFKMATKIWLAFLILLGWFSPLLLFGLSGLYELDDRIFNVLAYTGYTMFGFMIIFLTLLMLRDIVWYAIYGIVCLCKADAWSVNPKNVSMLNKANFIVFLSALCVTAFALHEGWKKPKLQELNVTSPLVSEDVRIVQISDLHITRSTPDERIRNIVYEVNALAPHVIVLTGDIMDDVLSKIDKKLDILKELQAPFGVYSVVGNHEFYAGLNAWSYKARQLGIHILFNRGVLLKPLNVFLSGIPDAYTAFSHPTFNINFEKALKNGSRENYRILLSHNPSVVDNLTAFNYNMMLSGHTHGGQLFPMHYFVRKANGGYLSGHYKVNGIDLYVSSGGGTWGPMMRLFAPSEITLINIFSQK